MRKNFNFLKKLSLFITITLIYSCNKEMFEEYEHSKNVSKSISLQQFLNETKINNFSNTIHLSKPQLSKNGNSTEATLEDFIIDEDVINRVDVNNKVSYTFQINSIVPSPNKIHNLIYYNKNGIWDYIILEYIPSQENLEAINNGTTKEITTGTVSKLGSLIAEPVTEYCDRIEIGNEHCQGCTRECDRCNACYTWQVITICGSSQTILSLNAGGSTGGSTDPTAGGGGGGSNGSTNPSTNEEQVITTDPIVDPVLSVDANTPCNKLKKLAADVGFVGKMRGLIGASTQWAFEKCHTIYNNPTPTTNNDYTYQNFQGTVDKPQVDYSANTSIQGVIHSHYQGILTIFSVSDLVDLYQKMKIPEVTDDFFTGVVCPQGNAYLMQVDDRATFIAFGDKYLSDEKEIKKFSTNLIEGKYNIKIGNSASDNEKGFTKMIKELNIGINIAKETFNPSANAPVNLNLFKNWQKLSYNSVTNQVETNNCN